MTKDDFINSVFELAKANGYSVELNRNGQEQADFGHKKLHSGHLSRLYPHILSQGVNVSALIDQVAPGRPCSHGPMKDILRKLHGISC